MGMFIGCCYPARVCTRGKVISSTVIVVVVIVVVVVVSTKIAKSQKNRNWQSALCHQTVESHEKLSSVCFKLLRTAYEHYKSCIFTGHAYLPHLPMPCAVMLDLKIGKGRQATKSISWSMHTRHYSALLLTQGTMLGTLLRTGTMAHGVCALKSSSFITTFTHWETSSHMEKSTSSTVGRQYLRQHRLRIW